MYRRWISESSRLLDRPVTEPDIVPAVNLVHAVVTLLGVDAATSEREIAARFLARRLPSRLGFRSPPYAAVRRLLTGHLIVAANRAHDPQFVRLGREWEGIGGSEGAQSHSLTSLWSTCFDGSRSRPGW